MATISGKPIAVNDGGEAFSWENLADTDVGGPARVNGRGVTVSVGGTFGTSGAIKWEGSNDGTNWFGLTKDGTNAAVLSAGGFANIYERPVYIRPNKNAGTGYALNAHASVWK